MHENMRMIHEIRIKNCTLFMWISYRHICMIFAKETFYLVYTRFVYDFHTKRKSHENHASLPCKYMSKTNFLKYTMLTKQKNNFSEIRKGCAIIFQQFIFLLLPYLQCPIVLHCFFYRRTWSSVTCMQRQKRSKEVVRWL